MPFDMQKNSYAENMENKIFKHVELGHHASALAHLFHAEQGSVSKDLLLRFKANKNILFQAYYILSEYSNKEHTFSPSTEWFLDNFYLIREQTQLIQKHYSHKYNKTLPLSSEGQIKNAPRIYNIIIDFVEHMNGHFDLADLNHFISSFQRHELLTIGELWAVPIMLRISIIEKLRRLCVEMVAQKLDRENAQFWFKKFVAITKESSSATINLIRELAHSEPTLTPAFVSEFSRCCHSQEAIMKISLAAQWIEMKLKESGSSTEHYTHVQGQRLAKEQIEMTNLITSIRLINQINWQDFTEDHSALDQQLNLDPANIYSKMDFHTRDRYRTAIEKIARASEIPEWIIAEKLVDFSKVQSQSVEQHVGYYLIDAGQEAFLHSLGIQPYLKTRVLKLIKENAFRLFFFGFTASSLWMTYQLTRLYEMQWQTQWGMLFFVALGIFLLTSQALLAFIFSFFHRFIAPKHLPRMDYSNEIPLTASTLVVVPTLLLNESGVQNLLKDLEIRHLGNQSPHLQFALLTDFRDADTESTPSDTPLLKLTEEGIQSLNKKYQSNSKFFLFHRPRLWNPTEKKWMGYERKRGKLEALGHLLNGQGEHFFSSIIGQLEGLQDTKYIITLDTDTQLTPGAAHKLIGNIDHPLNRPIFDEQAKKVRRGYGLLQPRIGSGMPLEFFSLYFKLYNPEPGVNPYTKLVSDIYQDFFEEGSFIGKGIYDRKVFHCMMEKRFPENRILSHDLIEGCFVRSGLVSDVVLYEDQPQEFLTDVYRRHRWTRGDWQIASWLLPQVPGFQNRREKNQLSGLSKWKIFDNLRRSCVSIAAMGLFTWSLSSPEKPGLKLATFILLILGPFVFGAIDQLIISLKKSFSTSFISFSFKKFYKPLIQGFLHVVFLPIEALQNIDAIGRTLFRLVFSKHLLLEWTCFHSLKSAQQSTLKDYFRIFWLVPVFAVLLFFLLTLRMNTLSWPTLTYALLIAAWGFSPGIAWWISNPTNKKIRKLKNYERSYLQKLAQDIWSYFDTFETEENHWLPPDNVQGHSSLKVANRTSPTNIGLSLVSALASWDLGLISNDKLVDKIQKQFSALDTLERYRGHFLNWYDTVTLQPLLPKYISTVDSGNFIGSLYVLKQGLKEVLESAQGEILRQKIQALLLKLDNYLGADFSFLFDTNVKLFTIGFNVTDQRRDSGYYDLLASEARLTSYLAIVTGQVPMDHWFALGRTLTSIKGKASLLSWSGSMFEYLMPNLYMPLYKNSLVEVSCSSAVASQVEYGKVLGIPWGMSESGYFATDQLMNYQYRAFGVPELGYKRDLQYELVIAPYASALALMVDHNLALSNLQDLEEKGFRGSYGFFEAIDYTRHRLPKGNRCALVQSFMAHHQGMSMIAITNLLRDNIMIRRFLADPKFQAFEILMQESVPETRPIKALEYETAALTDDKSISKKSDIRVFKGGDLRLPEAGLLSNGHYHLLYTNNGTGYSRCQKVALTPWRDEQLQCFDGLFFYVTDIENKEVWSTSYFPTETPTKVSEVRFFDSHIEVERQHLGINCKTHISISPVDNLEIRSLSLTNTTDTLRELKVTSFAEVAMAPNIAFLSHPSFSKLFIESFYSDKLNAIICQRRRRSAKEPKTKLYHFILNEEGVPLSEISFETDRMKFIGRDGSIKEPQALHRSFASSLSNGSGATLDPIVSLQCAFKLPPKKTIKLHFCLGFSENEQQVENLIMKYSDIPTIKKIPHMAWTHSKSFCEQSGISDEESFLFNKLSNYVVFPTPHFRGFLPSTAEIRSRNVASLWQYGISGDRPIILVSVSSTMVHEFVRQILKAHGFLRHKGLLVDLILLSTEEVSYRREISDYLTSLTSSFVRMELVDRPEGVFVRRAGDIQSQDRIFLKHLAVITLLDTEGSLEEQLDRVDNLTRQKNPRPTFSNRNKTFPSEFKNIRPPSLRLENNFGGYSMSGNEYCIRLSKDKIPPLPWVNVIANPYFGTVISERGSSYSWYQNSHEYRISPWYNDFVEDKTGECLYLRDENSGAVWSPLRFSPEQNSDFVIRHGFGYSQFDTIHNGIHSKTTVFVMPNSPIKVVLIELVNTTNQPRRLSGTYFVDLTLGEHRFQSHHHILTEVEKSSGLLFAQNPKNVDFSNEISFLKVSAEHPTYTCDRSEFIGRSGSLDTPEGLKNRTLSLTKSGTIDPSFALQGAVEFGPNKRKDLCFFLGTSPSLHEAQVLLDRLGNISSAHRMLHSVKQQWQSDLDVIEVTTGDQAFDLLGNGWLLYQTMSARFFGRTGFYQSGGAYGFRDQLQDAMAFVYNRPDLLREQIIRCASMQFIEGDVLHWWHPPHRRGVRTKITDDLLWLPLAVSRYVKVTGDVGLLNERTAFLVGPEVPATEESHYSIPATADQDGTIYEHCVRAIRKSLQFGRHGLPLMGGGDWNDGMNDVGHLGRGESVWLAFFLHDVLLQFREVADLKGDHSFINNINLQMQELVKNIELHAWDGEWYRRAYFDDGTPLGSSQSPECQIDLLPQCWSVLSGVGSRERMAQAMESVVRRLVDHDGGLIRLLDPPFDGNQLEPGYIKGYVPGTRENGAQYTHAAIWTIMALVKLERTDLAWEYFAMVNPINHSLDSVSVEKYMVEPYVIAADVYSRAPHQGRGGWTWYTGSAAWAYRLLIEFFIGLEMKEGKMICFKPSLPKPLNTIKVNYRFGKGVWEFQLQRIAPSPQTSSSENKLGFETHIEIDGQSYKEGPWIELFSDGKSHKVNYAYAKTTPST